MNGICHKIGGTVSGVITTYLICPEITLPVIATSVVASQLGSLIPDIDEPNSILGKKVKLLSKGLKTIFGHRGIIHTPIFLVLLSFIIFYFGRKYVPPDYESYFYLAFINFNVGYVSHLFLDMLTPAGIMLFYPFSKNKFKLMSLKGQYRDLSVSAILITILLIFLAVKYNVITINVNAETIAGKITELIRK